MVCGTYFENSIPIIFAKIVHYKEKVLNEKCSESDYKQFIKDICIALKENYSHYDENRVFDIKEYGNFFK